MNLKRLEDYRDRQLLKLGENPWYNAGHDFTAAVKRINASDPHLLDYIQADCRQATITECIQEVQKP